MATTNQKVRWGILGTANIARKNWAAIHTAGNGSVTAVGSRDIEKSKRFIAECQAEIAQDSLPEAIGSYDELIHSKNIDAVYIPLPTGLRKEWVLKAAAAGKHVVCEKPCGSNLQEVREMTDACKRHGVQFMDGVMFMHSRRLDRIREVLQAGRVGEVKRIATGFSFYAPPDFLTGNIRVHSQLEPHGCLGDLGWYCIRFALWLRDWKLPRQASGRMLAQIGRPDSPAAVPTEFSGELLWDDGVSMTFYSSFLTENQQWVHVSGTKGYLKLDDFVLPFFGSEAAFETDSPTFRVEGCRFNMESHPQRFAVEEYSNNHSSSQETNLFRNFSAQVLQGTLNAQWPEMALKTQQTMEACLASARSGGALVNLAG